MTATAIVLEDLPPGFTARPGRLEDVTAIAALFATCELAAHGVVDITESDLRAEMQRPSFDVGRDTVVVTDRDGEVVGYADTFGERATGHVHPDHRGLGLGTRLLAWTEAHAASRGAAHIGQTLSEAEVDARALLTRHGYAPRWDSWFFQMPLDDDLPTPLVPAELTLRTLRRPDDDRALYDLVDTAFNDWPDRNDGMSFEDWTTTVLDHEEADPDLVFVLEHDDGLVGAAICIEYDGEGWVDQLAVARPHRGRGLASVLLRHAFRVFAARGLAVAGLSTDSRTGAKDLYEHVGMRVLRTYVRLSKPLS